MYLDQESRIILDYKECVVFMLVINVSLNLFFSFFLTSNTLLIRFSIMLSVYMAIKQPYQMDWLIYWTSIRILKLLLACDILRYSDKSYV